jgi:hypothetical protein
MTLRYPEQIASSKDYIKFEFGEYKSPFRSPPSGTNPLAYGSTLSFTSSGSSIYLPMPNDIQSSFGGNWGGKDVTGLAQAALGTAGVTVGNFITNNIGQKITGFGNLLSPDGFKNAGGALAADVVNSLSTAFANLPGLGANLTATDVLQLTTESIVNPNTELLYSGTGLRTHGYTFKLIPQSKKEANDVMEIVERFKIACAPKQKSAAFGNTFKNFIGIPDLCQVSFIGSGGGENPYLPKYKVSGITSVNVNYVTDGQFVAYEEGHPLGVVLTVALTETKLIFSEEIGSGAGKYR